MKSTAAKLTLSIFLVTLFIGLTFKVNQECKKNEAIRLANYLIDHEEYSADLAYQVAFDFYGLN